MPWRLASGHTVTLVSAHRAIAGHSPQAYTYVMDANTLKIATYIAMGLVLAVLIAGIVNLSMASKEARSRSNQLMRLRVVAQFFAIVLLMVGFWLKTRAN